MQVMQASFADGMALDMMNDNKEKGCSLKEQSTDEDQPQMGTFRYAGEL